jgi:hypothetical protein
MRRAEVMVESSNPTRQALVPIPELEGFNVAGSQPPDPREPLGRRVIRQTEYPAALYPMPWFAVHELHRLGASLHEVAQDQPEVGIRAGQYVLIEGGYVIGGATRFEDDQLLYVATWVSESERRVMITRAGTLKTRGTGSYVVHGVVRAVFDRAL